MLSNWRRDLTILAVLIGSLLLLNLGTDVMNGLRWSVPFISETNQRMIVDNQCEGKVIAESNNRELWSLKSGKDKDFVPPTAFTLRYEDESGEGAPLAILVNEELEMNAHTIAVTEEMFGENPTIVACASNNDDVN